MRMKICFLCTILLILGISITVYAQVQEDHLVGWWRFDDVSEETGNWGDVVLHGATLEDGQLVVAAGKWAHALDYTGPDITEITLASWLSLDSYAKTNGSALTLDQVNADQFCGIVWAERNERQWMPGSSFFHRTNDFPNVVTEDDTGEMHFVAITYMNVDNQYTITGYRNGESMGSFNASHNGSKMELKTWTAGNSEAIWGKRHTAGLGGPGDLNAHIEESRIYNVALTAEEVMSLHSGGLTPVEPTGKLATQWGLLKAK